MTMRQLYICFQYHLQEKWLNLSYLASYIYNSGYVKQGKTPNELNPLLAGKTNDQVAKINLQKEGDKKLLRTIFNNSVKK